MDNTRYAHLIRVAGIAGIVSALVLLVNAAKRGMLIPTVDATQLLAPLAEVAAILFVLGLLLWSGLRTRLAAVATIVNVVALALLVGVEFVINLVFAAVDPGTTAALLAGAAGTAITATSVTFLAATVLLVLAFWRRAPRWALLTYGVGAAVVSMRAFVPELVLDVALAVMAVGVIGLSVRMLSSRRHAAAVVAAAA